MTNCRAATRASLNSSCSARLSTHPHLLPEGPGQTVLSDILNRCLGPGAHTGTTLARKRTKPPARSHAALPQSRWWIWQMCHNKMHILKYLMAVCYCTTLNLTSNNFAPLALTVMAVSRDTQKWGLGGAPQASFVLLPTPVPWTANKETYDSASSYSSVGLMQTRQ